MSRTHTSTYEGTITYPDALAFAFNPSPIVVDGSSGVWVSVSASDGTHTYSERRTPFGGDCTFDLSVFARALLSQKAKAEPPTSVLTNMGHTVDVSVTITTFVDELNTQTYTFSSTYVFGLLRHGEEFNPVRHRTYWRNYPFTVGVYLPNGDSVGYIVDGSAQSVETSSATGIYEIPVSAMGVTESLVVLDGIGALTPTTFTDVFDMSFSLVDGDDITERVIVDVSNEQCPRAVYLRWLDNQGFYCYWLFSWLGDSYASEVDTDIIRDSMAHYQQGAGYQGWYGHREQRAETQTKSIGASMVDAETFAFLRTLLTSPRVDRYLGKDADDNPMWENVRVSAQATAWNRHKDYQDFSCNLIMPKYEYQGV